MRGRHLRYRCAHGVASVRIIAAILALAFSQFTYAYCYTATDGIRTFTGTNGTQQCVSLIAAKGIATTGSKGTHSSGQCYYYPASGGSIAYTGTWSYTGTTLESTCEVPVSDPCASKSGTTSTWQKVWPSADSATPIYETTSNGGCGLTVSTLECGASASGEYSCWGTGTYTGTSLAEQEGGGVADCTQNCTAPEPLVTTNDQQCTANGSGGFTCTTSSSSSEFASSECTVGSVGGSTGYVCVQSDYVPESAAATKTDDTTVTQNPDGTTTTTVTSSTDNTYCSGSGCTTTTTTNTGSTTTDAAGNVLGKTEDCTGPNCAGPTDETKEEEPEEFKAPSAYTAPDASAAMPVLEQVPTYAETFSSFKNRVGNAPLVAGLSNITVPSGGSCDIGSANLFGGSISFNHFCTIAPSILSGLTYLFLAIWAWAAIRLFFTA
jgi:hypothetical protein